MSNFLVEFPEMPNKQFREFKKGVDASYKDFAREWGDFIDAMFEPLLKMLVFFETFESSLLLFCWQEA